MPTKAEHPYADMSLQQSISWTDALPVCRDSAVGWSPNQIYLEDGKRQEAHEYEDCSCHICVELDSGPTYLYGVFDGNDGIQAANFALQRIAAEILLDSQLIGKTTDEEVKDVLRQAFLAVEKSYWDSLDDKLAERTSVQCEIPEGITPYEAYQKYPHLVDKLNTLNTELCCGTTAVVALIYQGRLYVANVGDSRALLCRTDDNGVLRVIQLSVDHDIRNEDELLRLYKLGLNVEKLRQGARLGKDDSTRCIGNYLVKGGYKDIEELSAATAEPVIADPDIHGGITLDSTCRFLLLMSDGLYKTLQESTGFVDSVNKEIAQMAVEQFRDQSTLTGVAQAVVDKVARIHHDMFMEQGYPNAHNKRDDITLIIRNFNFPMEKAINSAMGSQVRFNPVVMTKLVGTKNEKSDENDEGESDLASTNGEAECTQDTTTTSTTDTSDVFNGRPDQIGRIDPYVDFSQFYRNVETARQNGTLRPSLG